MLSAQCSAALNQRPTVNIGQTREKRAGLNFLSFMVMPRNWLVLKRFRSHWLIQDGV